MKTRIIAKTYFDDNKFWYVQVWEKNFKQWWTVEVASSESKAIKAQKEFLHPQAKRLSTSPQN